MTVSFVGAQGAVATTVTIPTHQIGDLILIFAYRDAYSTPPTTPTAGGTVPTWTLIGSDGANTNSTNFRYAVATATNTTSGTWTNATDLLCLVYRGATVGAVAGTGGNATTTINYPALALNRTDNSSWVVGVAGHKAATDVEQAPGAMVNRISAGSESAGHDTNGTVTTWASTSVTVNTSSAYRSWVVELRDKSLVLPVDKGTYTLTGNAVTLTEAGGAQNYTLVVDKGTYALTGNANTLLRTRVLPIDKGTFTLTGRPVTTLRSYRLLPDKGTYTYTGRPVVLNGQVPVVTTRYILVT